VNIDAKLSAKVFSLLQIFEEPHFLELQTEELLQRIDIAILKFLKYFKMAYIGEQSTISTKIYRALTDQGGEYDNLNVMEKYIKKIFQNLKTYKNCANPVIISSLELFEDLSLSFLSSNLLVKLSLIQYIFKTHRTLNFRSLAHLTNSKIRTTFYATLCRLLFLGENTQTISDFIKPFEEVLLFLRDQLQFIKSTINKDTDCFNTTIIAFINIMRDLTGLIIACSTRKSYSLIFSWLYPYFPTILAILEIFGNLPVLSAAALRFLCEFVHNKSQRIDFGKSSPNGIFLFREVSKILVVFNKITKNIRKTEEKYRYKYKSIWRCLQALSLSLRGYFCNFAIFKLYEDKSLDDAFDAVVKMIMEVPMQNILAYRKVNYAYYGLLEIICGDHLSTLILCNSQTFLFFLKTIEEGLRSTDERIITQCSASLDHIFSFYYEEIVSSSMRSNLSAIPVTKSKGECEDKMMSIKKSFNDHMSFLNSDMISIFLTKLIELAIFETKHNQWSLSRPMLPLLLLSEDSICEIQFQIIKTQPKELQEQASKYLQVLTTDNEKKLDSKNRDKLTQKLVICCHGIHRNLYEQRTPYKHK
jgi:exportin-7